MVHVEPSIIQTAIYKKVSWLVKRPDSRETLTFGTAKCVLFIQLSTFHGVQNHSVYMYIYTSTHTVYRLLVNVIIFSLFQYSLCNWNIVGCTSIRSASQSFDGI